METLVVNEGEKLVWSNASNLAGRFYQMLYVNQRPIILSSLGDLKRIYSRRLAPYLAMRLSRQFDRTLLWFSELAQDRASEKAVIVCNGPSLLKTPTSFLATYPLVGLNFGALQLPDLQNQFLISILADSLLLKQNLDQYNDLPGFLFTPIEFYSQTHTNERSRYYASGADALPYSRVSPILPSFGNSTSLAIQILFFCGFRRVAIVGADHDYGSARPLSIGKAETVRNHYAKSDHAPSGQEVQMPDLLRVSINLRNLAYMFADYGGALVNCTDGGKLESIQRMSPKEFDKL